MRSSDEEENRRLDSSPKSSSPATSYRSTEKEVAVATDVVATASNQQIATTSNGKPRLATAEERSNGNQQIATTSNGKPRLATDKERSIAGRGKGM